MSTEQQAHLPPPDDGGTATRQTFLESLFGSGGAAGIERQESSSKLTRSGVFGIFSSNQGAGAVNAEVAAAVAAEDAAAAAAAAAPIRKDIVLASKRVFESAEFESAEYGSEPDQASASDSGSSDSGMGSGRGSGSIFKRRVRSSSHALPGVEQQRPPVDPSSLGGIPNRNPDMNPEAPMAGQGGVRGRPDPNGAHSSLMDDMPGFSSLSSRDLSESSTAQANSLRSRRSRSNSSASSAEMGTTAAGGARAAMLARGVSPSIGDTPKSVPAAAPKARESASSNFSSTLASHANSASNSDNSFVSQAVAKIKNNKSGSGNEFTTRGVVGIGGTGAEGATTTSNDDSTSGGGKGRGIGFRSTKPLVTKPLVETTTATGPGVSSTASYSEPGMNRDLDGEVRAAAADVDEAGADASVASRYGLVPVGGGSSSRTVAGGSKGAAAAAPPVAPGQLHKKNDLSEASAARKRAISNSIDNVIKTDIETNCSSAPTLPLANKGSYGKPAGADPALRPSTKSDNPSGSSDPGNPAHLSTAHVPNPGNAAAICLEQGESRVAVGGRRGGTVKTGEGAGAGKQMWGWKHGRGIVADLSASDAAISPGKSAQHSPAWTDAKLSARVSTGSQDIPPAGAAATGEGRDGGTGAVLPSVDGAMAPAGVTDSVEPAVVAPGGVKALVGAWEKGPKAGSAGSGSELLPGSGRLFIAREESSGGAARAWTGGGGGDGGGGGGGGARGRKPVAEGGAVGAVAVGVVGGRSVPPKAGLPVLPTPVGVVATIPSGVATGPASGKNEGSRDHDGDVAMSNAERLAEEAEREAAALALRNLDTPAVRSPTSIAPSPKGPRGTGVPPMSRPEGSAPGRSFRRDGSFQSSAGTESFATTDFEGSDYETPASEGRRKKPGWAGHEGSTPSVATLIGAGRAGFGAGETAMRASLKRPPQASQEVGFKLDNGGDGTVVVVPVGATPAELGMPGGPTVGGRGGGATRGKLSDSSVPSGPVARIRRRTPATPSAAPQEKREGEEEPGGKGKEGGRGPGGRSRGGREAKGRRAYVSREYGVRAEDSGVSSGEEEESDREVDRSGQESCRESSEIATTDSPESWKGEAEAKQPLRTSDKGNGSANVSGRLAVEDEKEEDDSGSKREVGPGKVGGGGGLERNDGDDSDNDVEDDHGDGGDDSSEDEMYNLTVKTDHYGFFVNSERRGPDIPAKVAIKRRLKECSRADKWMVMLNKFGDWRKGAKSHKLRTRVRKGVPDCVRGEVWQRLTGSKAMMAEQPNKYAELVASDLPVEGPIEEDIPRTMYDHEMFCRKSRVPGRDMLRRVLTAYGRYDREVQYCQGINYICALFLLYMPEENAFWLLVATMQRPRAPLRELFLPGMVKAQEFQFVVDSLTAKYCKSLSAQLVSNNLSPAMYATQWFLTAFTQRFPYDLVTRVWDMFLLEDYKVFYRVCLALFKAIEADAVTLDLEKMNILLRNMPHNVDAVEILDLAAKIPLKHRHLEKRIDQFYQEGVSVEGGRGERRNRRNNGSGQKR